LTSGTGPLAGLAPSPLTGLRIFDAAGRRQHDAPLGAGRIVATDWSPGLYHVLRCVDGTCGAARWIKR
jgi:hypothetical protein